MRKILHNQYKYTCTDPVFTLHGLPSRRNCYVKATEVFAHNKALQERVPVVQVGCHFKPCVKTLNRQQMSPLHSVFFLCTYKVHV